MNPFSLAGRRALVTGANTGIGQAIAVALAAAGAEVVATGRSSMADTILAIAGNGGTAHELSIDLAVDPASGAAVTLAEERFGPLDILVNNAGIIRRAEATEMSELDWDDVLDLNLKAAFFLTQAFGRSVLATPGRTGKVINVASLLSFQGGIRVAGYTASKHGMAGVTRLLACEWAARGINVNAIAPGYVETNNTAALRADPERFGDILKRIPAGRWGRPEDIGGAAVFLAAPASDYVHGTVLPVDGGWLAR